MESADIKVQNRFHGGNNIACKTNYKYRTAATLYNLETWFVSGMYLSIPCIKMMMIKRGKVIPLQARCGPEDG